MRKMNRYLLLADGVAVFHAAYVAFVTIGFALIAAGISDALGMGTSFLVSRGASGRDRVRMRRVADGNRMSADDSRGPAACDEWRGQPLARFPRLLGRPADLLRFPPMGLHGCICDVRDFRGDRLHLGAPAVAGPSHPCLGKPSPQNLSKGESPRL